MSVPSDPLIDVCLARLPDGETYPLSERSRSCQTKRTVKISIGLLPYISIASVWRKRQPAATDLDTYRHRLHIDTSSCRTVALGELATSANAIPRRSYLFGASWRYVRRTLLVAVEEDGDPYGVMVPTAEIIRFYYAPSTRLAQALFWGEYKEAFNVEQSGIFEEGVVRIHLRRWLEDQDAWTLARYICSPVMQREASKLYGSLQLHQLNSTSVISEPDQALPCGFPFEGPTAVQGMFLRLPGPTRNGPPGETHSRSGGPPPGPLAARAPDPPPPGARPPHSTPSPGETHTRSGGPPPGPPAISANGLVGSYL
jgi:hypothetical protein